MQENKEKEVKCCDFCKNSKYALKGKIKERFGGGCGLSCKCHGQTSIGCCEKCISYLNDKNEPECCKSSCSCHAAPTETKEEIFIRGDDERFFTYPISEIKEELKSLPKIPGAKPRQEGDVEKIIKPLENLINSMSVSEPKQTEWEEILKDPSTEIRIIKRKVYIQEPNKNVCTLNHFINSILLTHNKELRDKIAALSMSFGEEIGSEYEIERQRFGKLYYNRAVQDTLQLLNEK